MIATCGTCNIELEHLGTFKTTVNRKLFQPEKGLDIDFTIEADIFRCRNCLRIVVWET